ncbi:MAG: hypothetical protein QM681_16880 [Novosphingobium sp.]
MLDQAFADIGLAFSAAFGGPYHAARVIDQVAPVYDDGGSITTPGGVEYRPCSVQIDVATTAMRQDAGFVEGSVRFIVLAATLTGSLGTDAEVEVLAGPFAGTWSVSSLERDPVAAGWVGVGRRA